MQIAKLCLRGNLVNHTAKNLNRDQSIDVDTITAKMVNDPEIASSKGKFKKQLAKIIKGEYLDQDAAETEFWISTWRAVLTLTYYTPLEYRAFGDASINNLKARKKGVLYDQNVIEIGNGISIKVEESLPIPPTHTLYICTKCDTIKIVTNERGFLTNPNNKTKYVILRDEMAITVPMTPGDKSHRTKFFGDFKLLGIKPGDTCRIVEGPDAGLNARIHAVTETAISMGDPRPVIIGSNVEMMKKAYEELKDEYSSSQLEPQLVVLPGIKPIHMIIRSRRTNPDIIFDSQQMKKMVKNYAWEFFGQILKENKRPMSKTSKIIKGSADAIALQCIRSILANNKESIKFNVRSNSMSIETNTSLLPMWMVTKIAELKREFLLYNVDIKVVDGDGIYINSIGDAPTISRRIAESKFMQTRSFEDTYSKNDDSTIREVLESQISNKEKLSDGLKSLLSNDAMIALIDRLPPMMINYVAIRTCPPPEFDKQYGSNPTRANIAEYLGVTTGDIKRFDAAIRMQMLALGIGPGSAQT